MVSARSPIADLALTETNGFSRSSTRHNHGHVIPLARYRAAENVKAIAGQIRWRGVEHASRKGRVMDDRKTPVSRSLREPFPA